MTLSIPPQQNSPHQPAESNLRDLFITGLEMRLQSLQTDAWRDIPKADMRHEQLPFHVGMILLTSANEEAHHIRREQLRTNPDKSLDVLPKDQLFGSFAMLTATMNGTPAADRTELLRQHMEGLWLRPERFVDTRIIATIGKLANSGEIPGISHAKSEKIRRIVPFALAVQGMIAAKLPLPAIVAANQDTSFPSPRNRARSTTTVNLQTGRTSVTSVQ